MTRVTAALRALVERPTLLALTLATAAALSTSLVTAAEISPSEVGASRRPASGQPLARVPSDWRCCIQSCARPSR